MADKPVTREEKYLAYLTGDYTGELPKPITRKEKYLYELCLKGMGGEVSPEEIKSAVNEYLEKNPVKPGATTEQAQQIEQNKTDIASLKTETSSLKESISTKITKFYASSQGETNLQDSDNGKIMDMMLYGKSEQKQYKGTNLAVNERGIGSVFLNGITFVVNEDRSITLNGLSEKNFDYYIVGSWESDAIVTLDADKDYTIRAMPQKLEMIYGTKSNFRTVSQTDGHEKGIPIGFIFIRIKSSGVRFNNVTVFPQINEGTTLLDFEPYTGGIPRPNPDYPQEIKSVVNPTVKVCGKNLFQPLMPTTTVNGVTVTNNGNGTYTLSGTAIANEVFRLDQLSYVGTGNLKKYKGTYTFSRSDASYEARVMQHDTWKTASFLSIGSKKDTKEINLDNCFIFISVSKGKTYNNVLVDLQFEVGSTATTYEPYHEQTVTLPYTLNAIPVSSGGNVTIDGQQYIADYVDVERGKLVRMCKEYAITGSEILKMHWLGNASYLRNVCCINNFENIVLYDGINPLAMSDMFIGKISKNTDDERAIYSMLRGSGDKSLAIKFLDSDGITTVDLAKQWLIEHKPKIVFVLSTSEEIDLTSEEVQTLKALATYYPTTNISVNSEQLDGYTVFNYPISMANGWNYVKQQLNDNRDYIYDMDAQSAEAYVNSEYAVALTELEV